MHDCILLFDFTVTIQLINQLISQTNSNSEAKNLSN